MIFSWKKNDVWKASKTELLILKEEKETEIIRKMKNRLVFKTDNKTEKKNYDENEEEIIFDWE